MPQELPPEQQAAFASTMQRLGLDPQQRTDGAAVPTSELGNTHPGAPGPSGPVFSSEPEESHVPPTLLQVSDVAHLKLLAGVPDEPSASSPDWTG